MKLSKKGRTLLTRFAKELINPEGNGEQYERASEELVQYLVDLEAENKVLKKELRK